MIGADGASVLNAISEATALGFLREIPAVEFLRQVWVQNYTWIEGKIRWRSSEDIPPAAQYIGSPYAVEAHYSTKRSTTWVGSKVHLTETCEKDSPHLITHVETTAAPVSDDARTALIHEGLKGKDLLPKRHIVDTGYVDAKLLIESQQNYQIDLLGPTPRHHQGKSRLDHWKVAVRASGDKELISFVDGLTDDEVAIANACTEVWSNGMVEGFNHKLKWIKRSSYGQAGFPLLQRRVRLASSCSETR